MNYREMFNKLASSNGILLARRSSWSNTEDKIAYSPLTDLMLEKRENGKWIPYFSNEEDGIATDWELTSSYS